MTGKSDDQPRTARRWTVRLPAGFGHADITGELERLVRNGFSHLRSALLQTSVTLPIVDGELAQGTWQQVVVLNFDNRERVRELVAVVLGGHQA